MEGHGRSRGRARGTPIPEIIQGRGGRPVPYPPQQSSSSAATVEPSMMKSATDEHGIVNVLF